MTTTSTQRHEKGGQLRVAMVTGATGAIGKAIARQLVAAGGYEVVLVGRSEEKLRQTLHDLAENTGSRHIRYQVTDLSRQSAIRALAEQWSGPLHILVNNAAVTPPTRVETPEGIELQFATNVLGYFWMIESFGERLKRSAPARVVNVASYWAGDLDIDDLEFKRRPYHNGQAYRQSKQANRMLTVAHAERFNPDQVVVNACHPGDVNSVLSNNLGFGGHETPEQGAETPIWLATSPAVGRLTGRYFEHLREAKCRFSENRKSVEALFRACHSY